MAVTDKPYYGDAIARRRFRQHKSLSDIERETDGTLYTKLLYRIENGIKHPKTLSTQQLSALLSVLAWSLDSFLDETGLQREDFIHEGEVDMLNHLNAPVTPLDADYLNNVRMIPVYEASAGNGTEGTPLLETVTVPTTWHGEYVAYRVDGVSMEPDIPNGSVVIIKLQGMAELGQTVVAHCPDSGWVVKQLRIDTEAQRRAVLASKHPDYSSILFEDGCKIIGVVVEVRWRMHG